MKLARFYEQSHGWQKKGSGYKTNYNAQATYKVNAESVSNNANSKSTLITPTKNAETVNSKPRPLTYSQRGERRQKGLCFYCDEKLVKGHECKKPQNFFMIFEEERMEDYEGAPIFDEDPNEEECDPQEQKLILAALGVQEVQVKGPIQVKVRNKDKDYRVLVDGGSTLNLVSSYLCKALDLTVQQQTPVTIKLPNGTYFTSSVVCPEFKMRWKDSEMSISAQVADREYWHLILGVN